MSHKTVGVYIEPRAFRHVRTFRKPYAIFEKALRPYTRLLLYTFSLLPFFRFLLIFRYFFYIPAKRSKPVGRLITHGINYNADCIRWAVLLGETKTRRQIKFLLSARPFKLNINFFIRFGVGFEFIFIRWLFRIYCCFRITSLVRARAFKFNVCDGDFSRD